MIVVILCTSCHYLLEAMMSPKNDLAAVLHDAQWLPAHWDQARDAIQFAYIPRELHSKLTFLSDEYLRELQPTITSAAMTDIAPPASGAPHYIFHSAFCCSTLLARALDVPGVVMGLKEPQICIELAAESRQRRLRSDVLESVIRLLARPFSPQESVVIKPGNEANVLAPALLANDERSRAIFMYAPLSRFLTSVANKGMWGRIWARRLYSLLSRDGGPQFGLSEPEVFELTDVQIAALAWLLHHAEGAALLDRFPGRVRTLDSETFLAKRAESLLSLARHFGFDLDDQHVEQITQGPAFQAHSKEIGRGFDPEARPGAGLMPVVKEEIAMVGTWAKAVADHIGLRVDMPPDSALVPAA